MRTLFSFLLSGLTMLYPFAVFWSSRHTEPRLLAGLLLGLLVLRLFSVKSWATPLTLASVVFAGFALWHNQWDTLRLYPVLVNVLLLVIFAWSLQNPPSIIERFARLQRPDLPPEATRYTRKVTQVWCGFFLLNGLIALGTALWGSFEMWSWYNGLIAYLLMGMLLAGEYLIRIKTQQYAK